MNVGDVGWVIDPPLDDEYEREAEPYPVLPWKIQCTNPWGEHKTRGSGRSATNPYLYIECYPTTLYATEREAWIAYADALQANVIRDACEIASVRRRYALDTVPGKSLGRIMRDAYALGLNDIADDCKPWGELPDEVKAAYELAAGAVLDAAAQANEEPVPCTTH